MIGMASTVASAETQKEITLQGEVQTLARFASEKESIHPPESKGPTLKKTLRWIEVNMPKLHSSIEYSNYGCRAVLKYKEDMYAFNYQDIKTYKLPFDPALAIKNRGDVDAIDKISVSSGRKATTSQILIWMAYEDNKDYKDMTDRFNNLRGRLCKAIDHASMLCGEIAFGNSGDEPF